MRRLALSLFSPLLVFVLGCDQQTPKPVSVPVGKGSEATGYVLFETLVVKTGSAEEIQAAEETWQRAHPEYRIRVIVSVIGGGGESLMAHSTDTTIKALVITAYRDAPVLDGGK